MIFIVTTNCTNNRNCLFYVGDFVNKTYVIFCRKNKCSNNTVMSRFKHNDN